MLAFPLIAPVAHPDPYCLEEQYKIMMIFSGKQQHPENFYPPAGGRGTAPKEPSVPKEGIFTPSL